MYALLALFPFCKSREIKYWGLEYVSWQHLFSDTVIAKALVMCFQTMDFIACVCDVWILEHIHAFQMSPLDLRSHFLHIVNKDHKAISVGARVHIEDLKAKNSHQTSSDTMHSLPVVCLLPGPKGPVHLAYCKCLAQAEKNCFLNSFDFGESFIRPLIKSFDGSRPCVCMAVPNIMQTLAEKKYFIHCCVEIPCSEPHPHPQMGMAGFHITRHLSLHFSPADWIKSELPIYDPVSWETFFLIGDSSAIF